VNWDCNAGPAYDAVVICGGRDVTCGWSCHGWDSSTVRSIRLLAAPSRSGSDRKGKTKCKYTVYEDLPRPRLRLVKQTLLALLRDSPSTLRLILFAQSERTLDVLFLTTRLFLALWSLIVALAGPPLTSHAIAHLFPSPPYLGQILVVRKQSGEIACARTDIGADVAAVVVDVLEFSEGLDEVNVITKVLCDFGRAAV
jgi:hypothetical protein